MTVTYPAECGDAIRSAKRATEKRRLVVADFAGAAAIRVFLHQSTGAQDPARDGIPIS
ncbi:hypothetical protein H7J88_02385 [Mycolicibacterium flavescens]|uniref:hypothetical protein n=1 Tax=Mycolicibacterium flavescens TaxID=1776 RepID=UPI0013F4F334|nr:hypothetical protein [Mycolicibacterium flavescens]MCV7278493.1 hypothetical protein [Mycolicibacterium flavescens]